MMSWNEAAKSVKGHLRVEPGYWFVPKMFGIGATPATWQGWALTIGVAVLLGLDLRFVGEPIARIGIGAALLILFTVICVRKTQGGWHWHWGSRK